MDERLEGEGLKSAGGGNGLVTSGGREDSYERTEDIVGQDGNVYRAMYQKPKPSQAQIRN